MAKYNYNRDVSDSNPYPVKVMSGAEGLDGVQRVFEPPLNLVGADFIEVDPSTEVTFDPNGSMFNLRNQSMVVDLYFGFEQGKMDRNVLLLPRSTSRVLNDQGVVYLWHNGSETVRVYFQRFEVLPNA